MEYGYIAKIEADSRNEVTKTLEWPLGDWIHGLPVLPPGKAALLDRIIAAKGSPVDIDALAKALANDVKDLTD